MGVILRGFVLATLLSLSACAAGPASAIAWTLLGDIAGNQGLDTLALNAVARMLAPAAVVPMPLEPVLVPQ